MARGSGAPRAPLSRVQSQGCTPEAPGLHLGRIGLG